MIGKLRGVIDSYGEDFVIVDVSGVGYVVHCSSRTLQHLPSTGEAATLAIETHVREDMIRLYGFDLARGVIDVETWDWTVSERLTGTYHRANDFLDLSP